MKAQGPDHWITTGIPNVCVCFYCLFSERKTPFYPPPLLNWKVAQEKVPWGIVLLLGGGFAVAKGCEVTSSLLGRWQGGGLPRVSSFTKRAAESLCTPPSQHPKPLCLSPPRNCTFQEDSASVLSSANTASCIVPGTERVLFD